MSNETKSMVPYRPSLNECRSVSEVLANSRFFADCRQGSQAVAKVLAGRELGLPPYASMTGIYNVKGRLTFSANAMATLIQSHAFPGTNAARFKYRLRKLTRTECVIAFFERESPSSEWEEVGIASFDEEDRKVAKLSGDNWQKYPRNMMFARAMSNGARMFCPAVFAGHTAYTPDEVDTRAVVQDDGNYVCDGNVVQSLDVQDAEVVSEHPSSTQDADAALSAAVEDNPALAEMVQLIKDTNTDLGKILAHYSVSSLGEMDSDAMENCIRTLKAKKVAH